MAYATLLCGICHIFVEKMWHMPTVWHMLHTSVRHMPHSGTFLLHLRHITSQLCSICHYVWHMLHVSDISFCHNGTFVWHMPHFVQNGGLTHDYVCDKCGICHTCVTLSWILGGFVWHMPQCAWHMPHYHGKVGMLVWHMPHKSPKMPHHTCPHSR